MGVDRRIPQLHPHHQRFGGYAGERFVHGKCFAEGFPVADMSAVGFEFDHSTPRKSPAQCAGQRSESAADCSLTDAVRFPGYQYSQSKESIPYLTVNVKKKLVFVCIVQEKNMLT